MDAKIQAENNAEIQAKKKANIHNLYLSKHYAYDTYTLGCRITVLHAY